MQFDRDGEDALPCQFLQFPGCSAHGFHSEPRPPRQGGYQSFKKGWNALIDISRPRPQFLPLISISTLPLHIHLHPPLSFSFPLPVPMQVLSVWMDLLGNVVKKMEMV
ncbi:MAG TPA: hypothetical protein EYO58_07955 [Flavobacteriales bacterium]|nr:hypothetical protein [Flavobacteriales bacterium]